MENDMKLVMLTSSLDKRCRFSLNSVEIAAIEALAKELFLTYGAAKTRVLVQNMCAKFGLSDDTTAKVLAYYDEIIAKLSA